MKKSEGTKLYQSKEKKWKNKVLSSESEEEEKKIKIIISLIYRVILFI